MDNHETTEPAPLHDNHAKPDLTPRRAVFLMLAFPVLAALAILAVAALCFFVSALLCAGIPAPVLPM